MSPQSEAKTRWDRENTVVVTMKLNKNTDVDILEKLDSVEYKQKYIKELIRADISDEWIPCSERLPEDNHEVLVYEKNYGNIYTAYYDSVFGWMTFDPYSDECFGEHLDIVAWMPIPKYKDGDVK